jgi:Fe2+ transport system protein FeoA
MTLNQLNSGDFALIVAIHADKALKQRFHALGLTKGLTVQVGNCSMSKKTMEISFKQNKLALRAVEAACIKITPEVAP